MTLPKLPFSNSTDAETRVGILASNDADRILIKFDKGILVEVEKKEIDEATLQEIDTAEKATFTYSRDGDYLSMEVIQKKNQEPRQTSKAGSNAPRSQI